MLLGSKKNPAISNLLAKPCILLGNCSENNVFFHHQTCGPIKVSPSSRGRENTHILGQSLFKVPVTDVRGFLQHTQAPHCTKKRNVDDMFVCRESSYWLTFRGQHPPPSGSLPSLKGFEPQAPSSPPPMGRRMWLEERGSAWPVVDDRIVVPYVLQAQDPAARAVVQGAMLLWAQGVPRSPSKMSEYTPA
jgi:hypothetical protein